MTTAARLLRLLALLQQRRDWTGAQLAERLGVSGRTIRNDVERLRSLDYPIEATPGAAGGYRLGVGASLPPLLLDDEEAIATAVSLRVAAGAGVAGMAESSLRALAKLERMLPSRLRERVSVVHGATLSLPRSGPVIDTEVLTAVADAIRARETLRFDYRSFDGTPSRRSAEPHRLVHTRGRWYLVAWDTERRDWRMFRADRISPRVPNGARFSVREAPSGGLAEYVERSLGAAVWRYRVAVTVHASAEHVSARLPDWVVVEPVDEASCRIFVGSDNPEMLALWLGMLDADFDFDRAAHPELVDRLAQVADRFHRLARST
ncbi:helix-turn-helix transcriptional regulator [Allokutzneria albata]|uniref:HTH domain-containing protein n=1 Tax=Allokutzneria albata TaxID=211114 RepID=A0A1G9SJ18_ALLAB|nr:WYL domain-containing protein [Allokutzneria albata]SDM34765.1 HTH domain-containing protein [Allokutzneria albata]